MDTINQWKELSFNTLSTILDNIAVALPNILGAIVILFVGFLFNKIVRLIVKRIFKIGKIKEVSEKINDTEFFGEADFKINIEKIILGFIKWFLLLVFIIIAADIVKLTIISTEIANLLRYVPQLISAVIIFVIGLYGAKFIEKTLIKIFKSMDFNGSKLVSSIVFYIIMIFVTVTAVNQAGIDTSIITNNFTLILGAFLLAFALAFGLGSKTIVADLLKTFYARKNYAVGDRIKMNTIEGTIESIDSIFVTLKTENGKLVIPIKEITENRIEVN